MPKKKKTRTATRAGLRTALVIAVVMIGVGGVYLAKFLRSMPGNVLLLDIGVADRYEIVQDEIDAELGAALRGAGLDKSLRETTTPLPVGKRTFHQREWSVDLPGSGSLARANLALTEAARRSGGIVRSSKEAPAGTVTLRVGSRRYTTHVITIRQSGSRAAHRAGGRKADDELLAIPGSRPRMALVIDDFGYSRNEYAGKFLEMDIPLTVSVIPELPFSKYIVGRAAEEGKQAILHLPMEAESLASEVPPVLTSMSDGEITSLVEKYLRETDGVIGVNNHLGSLATQDSRVMATVIRVLKPRKLFFLDSLTSNKSVAYTTAEALGVPAARNDLFIDADTEDANIIEKRLDRLMDIAKTRGYAIGIGHPRSWTYEAVHAHESRIRNAGIDLVFLSEIVE
jgi:polysaccharide deacetylase 2 family uncharacterized protein YibQ